MCSKSRRIVKSTCGAGSHRRRRTSGHNPGTPDRRRAHLRQARSASGSALHTSGNRGRSTVGQRGPFRAGSVRPHRDPDSSRRLQAPPSTSGPPACTCRGPAPGGLAGETSRAGDFAGRPSVAVGSRPPRTRQEARRVVPRIERRAHRVRIAVDRRRPIRAPAAQVPGRGPHPPAEPVPGRAPTTRIGGRPRGPDADENRSRGSPNGAERLRSYQHLHTPDFVGIDPAGCSTDLHVTLTGFAPIRAGNLGRRVIPRLIPRVIDATTCRSGSGQVVVW